MCVLVVGITICHTPASRRTGRLAAAAADRSGSDRSGNVTGVGKHPGGDDRADAGQSIRVEPDSSSISFSSRVRALTFFSIATSAAICSTASRRRVLPATSRGLTVARIRLA